MSRLTHKHYQRRLAVAMTIYVAAMLLVWPLARSADALWLKGLLAVLPAVPVLYVIGLMARKVALSDEFEQRVHLIALGVSSALVAALSLVGGLLAAAGVLALDGSNLIWVFPVIVLSYSSTRWWVVTRRYGGTTECDDPASWALPTRLLLVAGLMALVAMIGWWRGHLDDLSVGLLIGLGATSAVFAVIGAVRGLMRRRHATGAHGSAPRAEKQS